MEWTLSIYSSIWYIYEVHTIADFSNTEAPTSFLPARRAIWFECGSWLSFDGCFILFYRYRGAAVVPRSNCRRAKSRQTHVPIWVLSLVDWFSTSCCFPSFKKKKKKKKRVGEFVLSFNLGPTLSKTFTSTYCCIGTFLGFFIPTSWGPSRLQEL